MCQLLHLRILELIFPLEKMLEQFVLFFDCFTVLENWIKIIGYLVQLVFKSPTESESRVQVKHHTIFSADFVVIDDSTSPWEWGFLVHVNLNFLLAFPRLTPESHDNRHGCIEVFLVLFFECAHNNGVHILQRFHELQDMENGLTHLRFDYWVQHYFGLG